MDNLQKLVLQRRR